MFYNTIKSMREETARLDRAGNYWTDSERDELKALFFNAIGISEIAARLQRTESTVILQIEKMNLFERTPHPQSPDKRR